MKRIALTLFALLAVMALAGCMYNKHRTEEAKDFTAAQIKSFEYQKPLVELVAKDGESIELKGVSAFRVYAPRDTTIRALPQQESGLLRFGEKLLDRGAQVMGVKFASDTLGRIFDTVATNAGDHSTTTISYTDSLNDNSDHSQHGPIITDSQVIAGNVEGAGAGIGNDSSAPVDIDVSGDGSAVGDQNELVNGANNRNSGQLGNENRRDTDDDIDTRTCTAGAGGAANGAETGAGNGGACTQGG